VFCSQHERPGTPDSLLQGQCRRPLQPPPATALAPPHGTPAAVGAFYSPSTAAGGPARHACDRRRGRPRGVPGRRLAARMPECAGGTKGVSRAQVSDPSPAHVSSADMTVLADSAHWLSALVYLGPGISGLGGNRRGLPARAGPFGEPVVGIAVFRRALPATSRGMCAGCRRCLSCNHRIDQPAALAEAVAGIGAASGLAGKETSR
jgi:hypothetical protein